MRVGDGRHLLLYAVLVRSIRLAWVVGLCLFRLTIALVLQLLPIAPNAESANMCLYMYVGPTPSGYGVWPW